VRPVLAVAAGSMHLARAGTAVGGNAHSGGEELTGALVVRAQRVVLCANAVPSSEGGSGEWGSNG
jgi:hypothetical protein